MEMQLLTARQLLNKTRGICNRWSQVDVWDHTKEMPNQSGSSGWGASLGLEDLTSRRRTNQSADVEAEYIQSQGADILGDRAVRFFLHMQATTEPRLYY